MEESTSPVDAFVKAFQDAGIAGEEDAKQQLFKPTCCPDKIEIVPGVVLRRPTNVDYAPDIDFAESKVSSITSLAKAGKLSVLNITVEPGSGKTIHLPFRFVNSRVLVVLPALFDAWAAKLTCGKPSGLISFGYTSPVLHNVTYTDSYYAASLLTTGKISLFDLVFVDECDSDGGVTPFVANVAVPGVSFVRMSATPKSVNSMPRKALPVVEESIAPSLSDVVAVGEFVTNRIESRKMVMTPSAQAAELIASTLPGSVLLTKKSSPSEVPKILSFQDGPVTVVTDSSCNKGINLNLDFVLDFGLVETPTGTRNVTIPEQQQRKYRVGRRRPGVYCCPIKAREMTYDDSFSIFRSNLWCIANDLDSFPCDIQPPTKLRAMKLLRMALEPATVPFESPILSSSSSGDAFDDAPDISKLDLSAGSAYKLSDMIQVEDDTSGSSLDPFNDVPSWVPYYLSNNNHPNLYLGDMIYDHRSMTKGLLVAPDMAVKPAKNLVGTIDSSADKLHTRTYSSKTGLPVVHRRQSSSARSTETYGDVLDRKLVSVKDVEYTDTAPLKLKRGVRTVNGSLGTSYKALSVSGSYLVESGMLLAESPKVHSSLRVLPSKVAYALTSSSSGIAGHKATYCASWVVAKPLAEVDVSFEIASFSAGDAWAVPPVSEIPSIDLHTEYHASWLRVLSERVRHKQVLPMVIPAVGWPRRSVKVSGDVLTDALDRCEDPCYSVSEQQVVYRAWNVLAAKSASVAPRSDAVFADASMLLSYMASADRFARF